MLGTCDFRFLICESIFFILDLLAFFIDFDGLFCLFFLSFLLFRRRIFILKLFLLNELIFFLFSLYALSECFHVFHKCVLAALAVNDVQTVGQICLWRDLKSVIANSIEGSATMSVILGTFH